MTFYCWYVTLHCYLKWALLILNGCQEYNHQPSNNFELPTTIASLVMISTVCFAISAYWRCQCSQNCATTWAVCLQEQRELKVSNYRVVHHSCSNSMPLPCKWTSVILLFTDAYMFPPMLPCIKSIFASFGVYPRIGLRLLFNMPCGQLMPALKSDWLPTCCTLIKLWT